MGEDEWEREWGFQCEGWGASRLSSHPTAIHYHTGGLSREFREGLSMELLYANDLVLIAETMELLLEKVRRWKEGMEGRGLRVNAGRTKIM